MDTPSTASQPYQQPAGVTAPPTLPKVLVTQAASPTPPQQPMPPPPVKPTYQSLIAKNPVVSARIQNGDRIAVADIAMPFMSMVVFIVKWSLAAIPALLILAFVGGLVFTLISGLVLGALNF